MPLVAPTRSFNKIPLAIVSIAPALLVRISNYDSGEPFFGRSASGRFDDYRSPASKRFGTNYCGLSPSRLLSRRPTPGTTTTPQAAMP